MAVSAGICIIENLMFDQKEGNNVLDLISLLLNSQTAVFGNIITKNECELSG